MNTSRREFLRTCGILGATTFLALGIPFEVTSDLAGDGFTFLSDADAQTALAEVMALRIGRFCGNGPSLWLRLQQGVDLWSAEREMADELAAIEPADRGGA